MINLNKQLIVSAEKINKQLIVSAEKLRTDLSDLENKIVNRIDYIIEYCLGKNLAWYFSDAEEGSIGDVWGNINSDEIEGIIIGRAGIRFPERTERELIIIDKNNEERNLYSSFPTRWLFEDFEKEVAEGKIKYEEKQTKEKNKRLEIKRKTQDLAKSAMKKLSKDELAAIKRSTKYK